MEWFKKTDRLKRVLFVCFANSTRSPAAEYFFNDKASWWSGLKAFSRGIGTDEVHEQLGKQLFMSADAKKVIGDKESRMLQKHKATQVHHRDVKKACLILTMDENIRDKLRKKYHDESFKIFTFKGFVNQTDDKRADNEVYDPYKPLEQRGSDREYLKEHIDALEEIKRLVRKLIEELYDLKHEKGRK